MDFILKEILEQSSLLIAIFDTNDVLRLANKSFLTTFQARIDGRYTWATMMRENHQNKVGAKIVTDDIERWIVNSFSRRGKQAYRSFEADLCDGRWIHMTETLLSSGWMLCVATDISDVNTETRNLRQNLFLAEREANSDALTGLSSRRYILKLLEQKMKISATNEHPLHIAMFDIDHFKRINDSFGHNVGDFVLQDFAFQMQTSLRRDNPIGRLGGEEFVVILPELGSAQVHAIICRLVNKIREKGNSPNNICPSYTVSVGIAKYDGNEEIDAFLARADTALYQAKRSGRDQICTV